jgi:hypothetical protein
VAAGRQQSWPHQSRTPCLPSGRLPDGPAGKAQLLGPAIDDLPIRIRCGRLSAGDGDQLLGQGLKPCRLVRDRQRWDANQFDGLEGLCGIQPQAEGFAYARLDFTTSAGLILSTSALNGAIDDLAGLLQVDGFEALPISLAHGLRAGGYSQPHRDPFDRLLAAQAELDRLVLLSADAQLSCFPCQILW